MKEKYLKALDYYYKLVDKHGMSAASDGRNDAEHDNIANYVKHLEADLKKYKKLLAEELSND